MIPLFKTHFSVGKSTLTPLDVFSLAKEASLEQLVFVEDSFSGFRKINTISEKLEIPFVFGIRLSVVQESDSENPSKLVFFAKDSLGVKNCKNIYTKCMVESSGVLKLSSLSKDDLKSVKIGVPFYDSYIYQNIFNLFDFFRTNQPLSCLLSDERVHQRLVRFCLPAL